MGKSLIRGVIAAAAVAAVAAPAAQAAKPPSAHGHLLQLRANANQSSNWFGYNQGALEKGGLFNQISGDWTVPSASQHTAGQAESSSDWIGIGGGCMETSCVATDQTLIQTGTEQDVSSSGAPSYSAWWEIIPGPSLTISNPVSAGDQMHADLSELVPDSDVWKITLQDKTKGWTFTQTVPYPSTHGSAEWIEETPLLLGANAGFAALPNLTNPAFSNAKVNGANANLQTPEEMQLTDSSGKVIGAPSAPNATHDGFSACTWASSC